MNNTILRTTAGLFLATSLLAGCANAPTEQLSAARTAMQQADEAEADLYVSDLYTTAQDSLALAETEMAAQDAKFALTRDYATAERLLVYVNETAVMAAQEVDTRKEALRAETETLIAEAQQAILTANDLMAQAPRGKEGTIALVAIQGDAVDAETMLNDAVALLDQGDVINAHRQVGGALDKANSLIEELNAAIAKTQPNPRS